MDGPGIESQWGAKFSAPVQTGPGVNPASCRMGTRSFPGVESGRDVTLTPHPLLVPSSRNSGAIPLLSLRAFVACKKGETYLRTVLPRVPVSITKPTLTDVITKHRKAEVKVKISLNVP
jgi:hypothetical protein